MNNRQTENKKINTNILHDDFSNHLNLNNNNRIFFSAKFGSGKTTYLNEYFETNKDKYEVFKLYPVNYSVASNEDIFELIKYDLILELLLRESNGDIKFEKIEFGISLLLQQYILKNTGTISAGLAITELIEKLNKDSDAISMVATGATAGLKLFEHLKKFFDKHKIDNKKEIVEYQYNLKQINGSIYEYNNITQIIKSCINELTVEKKKESVLIIDDLDRLDPDHIFRLLNIFSAHNDINNSNNKFGFSKIILVGDIENIQHIFEHRYGPKTDFEGYINKFYSIAPYQFNISNIIFNNKNILFKYNLSHDVKDYFNYIIQILLNLKIISFRDFINFNKRIEISHLDIGTYRIYFPTNHIIQMYVLIFSQISNCRFKLEKLESAFNNLYNINKEIRTKIFFDAVILLTIEDILADRVSLNLDSHEEIYNISTDFWESNPTPFINPKEHMMPIDGKLILKTIIKALIKLDKILNP